MEHSQFENKAIVDRYFLDLIARKLTTALNILTIKERLSREDTEAIKKIIEVFPMLEIKAHQEMNEKYGIQPSKVQKNNE